MNKNILEYLEQSEKIYPKKTAVEDENGSLTYFELLNHAVGIGGFLSKYIVPREAIPVFMNKSCSTLALFFGIAEAGCFYSLIDPTFPVERIENILKTLEAGILIVDDHSAKKAEKLNLDIKIININEFYDYQNTEEDEIRLKEIRKDHLDIDPLYCNFTSGSTGVPKGVLVGHRSVIDFIDCFTDIFGINEKDKIGNQAPFDFDVSVKDIYSAMKVGATLTLIPRKYFSFPTTLLDYLDEKEVTTLIWAVSALCIITSANGFEYKKPRGINKVIFSGEVMPMKHLLEWRKNYPDAMFANVYGPTEITCNCTYYIVDREFTLDEVLPIGVPFPNERIILLDEENKEIRDYEDNKTGEICVSGTAVSLGYFNNREKTNENFVQNPANSRYLETIYRTGDLGYYKNGELYYSSRKDFQIKYMGHRIELTEIELAINSSENITRSCCIFREKENELIAFYEGAAEEKALIKRIKEKLPSFMVPGKFVKVEHMPLTKNGKIDRKELLNILKN